jgi:hypothetical protein
LTCSHFANTLNSPHGDQPIIKKVRQIENGPEDARNRAAENQGSDGAISRCRVVAESLVVGCV